MQDLEWVDVDGDVFKASGELPPGTREQDIIATIRVVDGDSTVWTTVYATARNARRLRDWLGKRLDETVEGGA